MAAAQLSHTPASGQISKHGILTLSGYSVKITMMSGHLAIEDGVGSERRNFRLPRVGHKLKRLVCLSDHGIVSLSALNWLANVGASFVLLDRRGKVQFVTGPTAPSESRLRRAQSLALSNGTALRISKELIARKVDGQATVIREMLHDGDTADAIARFKNDLLKADSISTVRLVESQAAKLYWSQYFDVPVSWPRQDEREVPDGWKRFGTRISPLTGSPRLAVNPAGAILNLIYALLESEARLSCVSMGLDSAIGVLHVDQSARDSLALDVLEPVRPKCDAFLLDWLMRERLRRSDFFELPTGNARLMSALAVKICGTSEIWRRFLAPVVEYVAMELAASISKSPKFTRQLLATRLTQSRKREAKGSNVPIAKLPRQQEHFCKGCGKPIRPEREQCAKCSIPAMTTNFESGRRIAHSPSSIARRSRTNKAQAERVRDWNPSELPSWLSRDVYLSRVVPALANVPKGQICSALNISWPWATWIKSGKRIPSARHWEKLAQLAGVSANA